MRVIWCGEKERARGARLREPVAADHGRDQQDHAENTGTGDADPAAAPPEHPHPHDQSDGNGGADGEHAPGAVGQRVDHHDAQAGQRYQQNEQHRDHGHQAGERADLGARDIGQRAAAMAHRRHQHGEILHAPGQHRPHQQPQKSGREAELRGQRGPTSGPAPAIAAK
jgi:hypothetical protein